ncbi:hypothetical protein EGW08_020504 [Elysia chlorotica]|uniref:G-protein coupled receptors family 1 profile domain-containing protein n=1 Tax=Elysia chlorotica TaxID=188477 RepID=A0A433SR69_ELYCH|nr:hypothetical protein EGW08_020504 [Elysia chlorotica]
MAEGELTRDWIGTLQEDFSLHTHHVINLTSALYHPWGSRTGSAIAAILYTAWISGVNLFLVFLLITNVKLLNSRQNVVLLHNAVSDLSTGVFYFTLTADFFIRAVWTHGCPAFFVWFTFVFPLTFLGCHSVLILLAMRLMEGISRWRAFSFSATVKNILLGAVFVLIWTYLVIIGAFISARRHDNVHIAIAPGVTCRALVASQGAVVINVLVYFLPASLSLLLLLAVVIWEKTTQAPPTIQLRLETDTERCASLPLPVLALVTTLTSVLPLPAFLITTFMASGACASVSCPAWLLPLGTVSDWVLFAKSGLVPIMFFLAPDFRSAAQGALYHFRRIPTSDTRDLVTSMADEEDDTPFSSM